MKTLTKQKYYEQRNNCDGLCIPEDKKISEDKFLLYCVTCPFCKEVVNAELTPKTIHCPACKITVER